MNSIVISLLVVGGCGLVIGLLLGVVGKKFEVEVDEKESAIREALPGNNCGGCGYPGCDGCAAAIAKGEAPVDACPVGGSAVAKEIGAIMGQAVEETARQVAFVHCAGDCNVARTDYQYTGIEDCSMMPFVPNGGPKSCNQGCLGFGSCVKACNFDAIHVINGVAVVDREACKACKACIKACPKHLISLVPYDGNPQLVRCSNDDRGKVVMNACDAGCIGCTKCVRNCPAEAITMNNNSPVIDYDKCVNCGKCAEGCPKGCIVQAL